jgi:hypothetical protein
MPIYRILVERGDIVVLQWDPTPTSATHILSHCFRQLQYRPLTLLNATAQIDLTHHHELDAMPVGQRATDGYINATAMCQAAGKEWADYRRLQATEAFLSELSGSMGIPIDLLTHSVVRGPNHARGTWVHPLVAVNLAQWAEYRRIQPTQDFMHELSRSLGIPRDLLTHSVARGLTTQGFLAESSRSAGIPTDLFFAEAMDDAALIRVYARENATQRGVSSTALAGTVAAALKHVAKGILTGTGLAGELTSKFDMPTVRRRLLSEDGMGREIVLAFLDDIPGINDQSVKHQLANLKYSGDYARLIAEVQAEIAAEQAAADAQELAHRASQAAAKHAITFDFHGVARHLKNPHQVDVFRELAGTVAAAMKYVAKGILTGVLRNSSVLFIFRPSVIVACRARPWQEPWRRP